MFLTSLPFLTLCIGLAIAFRRVGKCRDDVARLLVTVSVDERPLGHNGRCARTQRRRPQGIRFR